MALESVHISLLFLLSTGPNSFITTSLSIKKFTVTDKNGEIYVENLPIGEYKIREIKENSLYYPLKEDTTIKIEHNKTTTQIIENEKLKGRIRIIKVAV